MCVKNAAHKGPHYAFNYLKNSHDHKHNKQTMSTIFRKEKYMFGDHKQNYCNKEYIPTFFFITPSNTQNDNSINFCEA